MCLNGNPALLLQHAGLHTSSQQREMERPKGIVFSVGGSKFRLRCLQKPVMGMKTVPMEQVKKLGLRGNTKATSGENLTTGELWIIDDTEITVSGENLRKMRFTSQ